MDRAWRGEWFNTKEFAALNGQTVRHLKSFYMNNLRKLLWRYSLILFILAITLPAMSQQNQFTMDQLAARSNSYTDSLLHASVYLRTSKDIYESMEDLWFKAYLLEAQSITPFGLDKTLYVRLVKKDVDSAVWEEKYPIKNGMVDGHIYLDDSLPEGEYFLSAYSAHSFYRDRPFYALKLIKLIRQTNSLLKKNIADTSIDAPQQQKIHFSILPEGGQIVSGVKNRVAFKAVGERGQPVDVSGRLFMGDIPVKEFSSSHAGMGSFYLKPVPGAKYHIRLNAPNRDTIFSLPVIKDKGLVMHLLRREKDNLIFNILQSRASEPQTIFLRLQIRGRVQVIASGLLRDSLQVKIPTINSPQGIAEVTLFDQELRPLVERLVYLNPDRSLNISTTLSKVTYKTREKVSLQIRTSDKDGRPVQASMGVNVYDKLYNNPEDAQDILTHFYLSSQLKGKIYDPAYYFNDANKDRDEALDVLLLTQGWRSYLWNEDELKEMRNRKQVLTDSTKGKLIAVNAKRYKPKVQVLMAFSTDEREKRTVFTDSMGEFALAPEDFVKGRWSYLKRFDPGTEAYTISVEDQFKSIRDIHTNLQLNYPVGRSAIAEKNEDIPVSRINLGAINLDEVNIVARKQNVFRDKYMGRLDSIAKLDGNTDFVHPGSNWLNVPVGSSGTRPVEGQKYTIWAGNNPVPTSVPFNFGRGDFKEIIYHYPKFTEEELLKKFKLARIKGYYEKREFYTPEYDKEPNSLPDYRNTLLWAPDVVTDKKGQATLEFFCSDINSSFHGIIEGVGGAALLGKNEFYFNAVK